jgi:hypothetical protein
MDGGEESEVATVEHQVGSHEVGSRWIEGDQVGTEHWPRGQGVDGACPGTGGDQWDVGGMRSGWIDDWEVR